jgi:hypothetical protein
MPIQHCGITRGYAAKCLLFKAKVHEVVLVLQWHWYWAGLVARSNVVPTAEIATASTSSSNFNVVFAPAGIHGERSIVVNDIQHGSPLARGRRIKVNDSSGSRRSTIIPGSRRSTIIPGPLRATLIPGPLRSTLIPGPLRSTIIPGPLRSTTSPGPLRSTTSPGPLRSTTSPGPLKSTTIPGPRRSTVIPARAGRSFYFAASTTGSSTKLVW